jgi:serine/threonine protein kinase
MKQESDSIEYPVGQPMPGTKWVVHGKLGQGGMGIVLDVMKARLIPGAMKVLHPSFARMAEFADRFLEEVKVTAQLQHPNIVQVLDFDRLADGTLYMVMERLRGRTLRAALRETRQRGKAWTPANTYAVAAQVCEGLSRAHSHPRAIVHRDIKPENIYLHRREESLDSVVKVMDFGVAGIVGQRDRNQIGTPRYMAPEQLRGERVSAQTDQYALALVIYEMLTGRLPWDVDVRDISAMTKVHVSVAPAPPSTFCAWLPQRIDAAILKGLAKDPRARHESVHGLIFELRALQRLDRASSETTDVHSTDPMVGTLADGYMAAKEGPDASALTSLSLLEGQDRSIPELTGADVDFESSPGPLDAPAPPAAAMPQGAHGSIAPTSSDSASSAHAPAPRGAPRSSLMLRKGHLRVLVAGCALVLLVAAIRVRGERASNGAQPFGSQAREGASHELSPNVAISAPSVTPSPAPPAGFGGPALTASSDSLANSVLTISVEQSSAAARPEASVHSSTLGDVSVAAAATSPDNVQASGRTAVSPTTKVRATHVAPSGATTPGSPHAHYEQF